MVDIFSAYYILKDNYPDINFVFVKDTLEALSLVSKGEVYGAVDILPVINTYLTKYSMDGLKIAGLSKEFFNLQFMVNKENPQLIPILNKLISDFDSKKFNELRNSMFKVQKNQETDLTKFYIIIVALILVILVLFIRQIILNKSKTLIENEKLKFKSLMENASDGIHILDTDGNLIDCNKAFANSLGYTIEELKNMNVSQWDCLYDESEIKNKLIEIIKFKQTFSTLHKRKDGTIIDVEISAKSIILDEEEYIYASSRDLSDIKKAYEEIELLNKKLNDLNKNLEIRIKDAINENSKQQAILVHQNRLAQLGEMLSMIAHQWRQPLSALSVWISNLVMIIEDDDFDKNDVKKIEDKIKEIIIYLSTTIDEFKNYYNTENRKKEFILDKCVYESLKLLNTYIKENEIEIHIKSEENVKLYSYENLLKQVLVAITSNSIDALKDLENKRINISAKVDNQNVQILINDNANGIPNDIQEKIFDPYFTTKGELNGTGLGLYMSKMIVEKSLKGNLSFETSSNGTTFKIEFPISENIEN